MAQDERGVKSSSEKVGQATKVTPAKNMREEKSQKRLQEPLNQSTGQQAPKRMKDSTFKKVEQMKK